MPHPVGVVFNGRAGSGLVLYANSICASHGPALTASLAEGPTLGDNVIVGGHAAILGAVCVGSNTRVAHTVQVCEDLPSDVMASSSTMYSNVIRSRRPGGGF